ncbi:hypothetical protein [Pseudomonas sp. NyZ201]|uniref:hypothetical protein n=1 Tax=Pseudomonas sp. NyZ201 TaxID=3409857 RepID=UPI003CF6BEAB
MSDQALRRGGLRMQNLATAEYSMSLRDDEEEGVGRIKGFFTLKFKMQAISILEQPSAKGIFKCHTGVALQ